MPAKVTFQDILDYFGERGAGQGTQADLAAVLDCTRENVTSWGGVIPELWAYKVESLSKGKFKYSQMPVRPRRTRAA